MKIEYKVRPITRYVVTRYINNETLRAGGSSTKGEYDNPEIAYEVAYALCKAEHESLGWAPGDDRIQYPKKVSESYAQIGVPSDVMMTTATGDLLKL